MTWMDLVIVTLSKISQRKTNSYDIAYMWHLKIWYKWIYLQNRNRVTDVENKCMVAKGERKGGGIKWEFGIDTYTLLWNRVSLVAQRAKNQPVVQETWVWSLDWEDPLEKQKATHSSILVWRIPWTEEPGRLQSMGSQKVGHDRATFTM